MKNYKPLGEYIRQVDVRNKDRMVERLVGVSVNKTFIPSVANTIGTDLSNYKIIRAGQFACSLMQVSRDEKIPVAMYKGDDAIMSPAYPIFEIIDKDVLMPEYLDMWVSRAEFDREASYYAVGGVRGSLTWEDFCDMRLPVPPLSEQRRIVERYASVSRRIACLRRLIATLEETARTIYRHTFVDGIDKEQLPEGWRMGTVSELMTISSGKTLSDKVLTSTKEYPIPVVGAAGIIGYTTTPNQTEPIITTGRVGTLGVVNRYYTPIWTADNVLVAKSDYYNTAYQILRHVNYAEITGGGVQSLITQTGLGNYPLPIPPAELLERYEAQSSPIYTYIQKLEQEQKCLTSLQSLFLTRISQ